MFGKLSVTTFGLCVGGIAKWHCSCMAVVICMFILGMYVD